MRILLVGSGGREHAIAAALARSPRIETLLIAPGNPGTASLGRNVPVPATDIAALVALARAERIDLVIPGPEAPLVLGLADACAEAGIPCSGPTASAARLEGSKTFAREIATEAGVAGPRWETFTDPDAARTFARRRGAPLVVKADGLAAGKGVTVAATLDEAEAAIAALFADHPDASVVIEECLEGDEVSLFALCDGADAVLLGAAQDHKRIHDGDRGPNTGGMGAVSPPKHFSRAAQEAAVDAFVRPVLAELVRRETPFRGVLFAGLMLTSEGPRLIEYNVRFGDPEAQCLLPLLRTDLAQAFAACAAGDLSTLDWQLADAASCAIVMAAPNYPATPTTGQPIALPEAPHDHGAHIFHAGTALDRAGRLVSAGGRVLTVQATADTLSEAQRRAYALLARIEWPEAVFRRDIGNRSVTP